MRVKRRLDPRADRIRPRHNPANTQINMQVHQLLRRRPPAITHPVHLMRQVHPLGIHPQHPGQDAGLFTQQHLGLIQIMRLSREGAAALAVLVSVATVKQVKDQVGAKIEPHRVIS